MLIIYDCLFISLSDNIWHSFSHYKSRTMKKLLSLVLILSLFTTSLMAQDTLTTKIDTVEINCSKSNGQHILNSVAHMIPYGKNSVYIINGTKHYIYYNETEEKYSLSIPVVGVESRFLSRKILIKLFALTAYRYSVLRI